jgi:hypothetical protein
MFNFNAVIQVRGCPETNVFKMGGGFKKLTKNDGGGVREIDVY